MKHNPKEISSAYRISRLSGEPAYLELVKIIRAKIAAGEYPPASQIPSEVQICERYKVSRMTVRRAINLLVDQGVVVAIQGKGTFVKTLDLKASNFTLGCLQRLLDEPERNQVRFQRVDLMQADDLIASKLALNIGDWVIYISRVIERDGEAVVLHKEYLTYDPRLPIVESEMEVTKLRGLLDGRGKTAFKKGEFRIRCVVFNEEEAQLLKVPVAAAAIKLEHIFYDYMDRQRSWGWFLATDDRLVFTARAGIWDNRPLT